MIPGILVFPGIVEYFKNQFDRIDNVRCSIHPMFKEKVSDNICRDSQPNNAYDIMIN